jgi:hypothetical protein
MPGPAAKSKSKRTFVLGAVLAFILVLWGVSYFFGAYKNKLLAAEVEKILPRINSKLGVKVAFSDLKAGIFSGTEVLNLRVSASGAKGSAPFLEIPRLKVLYSILFRPSIRLKIEGIVFDSPQLNLELRADGSTNLPMATLAILAGGTGASGDTKSAFTLSGKAGRLMEIAPTLDFDWTDAKIEVRDSRFAKTAEPAITRFERGDGHAQVDVASKSISTDTAFSFDKDKGRLGLHLDYENSWIDVTLTAKDMRPAPLAAYMGDFIDFQNGAVVSGSLSAKFSPGQSRRTIRFDSDIRNLTIDHWRLADEPISHINVKSSGLVQWNTIEKSIHIPLVRFGLNGAFMDMSGKFFYGEPWKIEGRLSCDRMPLQVALDAFPQDFIPSVYGAKVLGSITVGLDVALDSAQPRKLQFDPKIKIEGYELVKATELADIKKLPKPFQHMARKNGEDAKEIWVGTANRDFVSYHALGPYTVKGVLTCEDGRFFRHPGFQLKHIRQSIVRNIVEKRFARGASTITMQTAKNLFLSGRKNFSRKFQEMLIAYALEQELSKERILEIYMNIIEWGPKLYGIGPAARHYFLKSPSKLDPLEAAFLGSIISNPVRHHRMYTRGEVTESWTTFLALIVSKMSLDPEVYDQCEPFQPEFGWVRKKREEEEKKAKEAEQKPKKASTDLPAPPLEKL